MKDLVTYRRSACRASSLDRMEFRFTEYSESQVLRKRPYLRKAWCIAVVVVLDYDDRGNLVGIDIDNASKKVDLRRLVLSKLPAKVETAAA